MKVRRSLQELSSATSELSAIWLRHLFFTNLKLVDLDLVSLLWHWTYLPMIIYQTWNWVTGSPGQWVIWVIFHVRVTGSLFWPGVRPEFSRFSKKCPKCKTYIWNAEMTKVIVKCLLMDWNHWMSVSPCNELLLLPMIIKNSLAWEYFFTHKSTCGVHYRTGSPVTGSTGSSGRWILGSLGCWVTKCDPVPYLSYTLKINQICNREHAIRQTHCAIARSP